MRRPRHKRRTSIAAALTWAVALPVVIAPFVPLMSPKWAAACAATAASLAALAAHFSREATERVERKTDAQETWMRART